MGKALRIVLVKTAAKALRGSHESNHRGPTALATTLHLFINCYSFVLPDRQRRQWSTQHDYHD